MNRLPGKSLVLLVILALGCESEDKRVARIATEAAERQADQNREMLKLNREVASGARRLVEQDATARREFAGVHRDLQAERLVLAKGWDNLESQRQQMALQRRRETILQTTFQGSAVVAIVLASLGLCWLFLTTGRSEPEIEQTMSEYLLLEVFQDPNEELRQIEQDSCSSLKQITDEDKSA